MFKKPWFLAALLDVSLFAIAPAHAADTKLSALPSATLTEADELYINDGGTSSKASVAELRTALVAKGFHVLDITSLREIATDEIDVDANHGGILTSDSTPKLRRESTSTDKGLLVEWLLSDVTELQFPPFPMPPDLDETVDVTIHLLAHMSSTNDTPTIDVQVFDAVGDTEMGGPTAALSDTLAELTVTIANANISGGPTGFFNISLVPGSHGTDALRLRAAWIEYTRKAPS